MVCTTVTTPNSTIFGQITQCHAKYCMEIHCLVYQYTTLYVTPANLHKHKQKICPKTVANLKTIIAQMDRLCTKLIANLVHKQKICFKTVANLNTIIAQMGRLCTNSFIQQIKYLLLFHFGFFALSFFRKK